MTVKKIQDRQHASHALVDLGVAQIGTGNEVEIALPHNAYLYGLEVYTATAFDGTTNTLTVSDGTTTFVNAVDVKSTGSETVTGVPKFFPSAGKLTVSMAQTGTAGAGRVFVRASYLILNRGGEICHGQV